ncbi:MAG: alpha/beta hydrolase [Mycobacteriales bacterium]
MRPPAGSGVARGRLQHLRLPSWVQEHLHPSAPLESPWVWRGFLGVTVLVVVLLVWLGVRHRRAGVRRCPTRRWVTRALSGAGVMLLVVLTGLALLNSYVGYFPTVTSLANVVTGGSSVPGSVTAAALGRRVGAHGDTLTVGDALPRHDSAVVSVNIGAPRLRVPVRDAYVYLPPGYGDPANAHRRYPVVYLIHGFPGRPADWMVAGGLPEVLNTLIADRLVGPMIVVAPDADGGFLHDSECLNQVNGPQVASYLTTTVVRYVDTHFRTIATRDGRAMGGASSGGYCALNLGLRYQDTFSTILAFEPYGDPGRSVITPLLAGSQALFRANSPSYYLAQMHLRHPAAAFLDAGGASTDDVRRVQALVRLLLARGVQVAFRAEPSQSHTWKEAVAGLPYGLYFAAQHLTAGRSYVSTGHHITTVGSPDRKKTDAFAQRYARQVARCRRLGAGYQPAGAPGSTKCTRPAHD